MKNVDDLNIRSGKNGAVLPVKAVPNSSRDKIAGVLADALKIATSAPPEKGKANKSIVQILAKSLKVNKRGIMLISGETSPQKEFLIEEMTPESLKKRLTDL